MLDMLVLVNANFSVYKNLELGVIMKYIIMSLEKYMKENK